MIINYTSKNKLYLSLSGLTGQSRSSFTLIELLVVLALVAILSVVVVMTLNPAELLKQARDSNRLSDISTINTALNLFSTDVTSGFMGTSTIVYVSVPDDVSSVCDSLGLPVLPSGYTYNCATTANLRNIDGTGWIPVNFQRISSNSPISQLPIDPINTTSTNLYYVYMSGGSWQLLANPEASKNKFGGSGDLVSKDGGSALGSYEVGNNLTLYPMDLGDPSLITYWNFEEGPNTTSTDKSGYRNDGAWYGTSTTEQHYGSGKVGLYAGNFNGSSDYVYQSYNGDISGSAGTISLWWNTRKDISTIISQSTSPGIAQLGTYYATSSISLWPFYAGIGVEPNLKIYARGQIGSAVGQYIIGASGSGWYHKNQWQHIAIVWRQGSYFDVYMDGVITGTYGPNPDPMITFAANRFYVGYVAGGTKVDGLIDDVRVYNRALSATEVSAIYNATK